VREAVHSRPSSAKVNELVEV